MALTWDTNFDWSSGTSLMNEATFGPIYAAITNFNIEALRVSEGELSDPPRGEVRQPYYLMDQAFTEAFVNKFYYILAEEEITISGLETDIGVTRPEVDINTPPSAGWLWWMKEALDILDANGVLVLPSSLIIDGYYASMFAFPSTFTDISPVGDWRGDLRLEDPGSIWGSGYDSIYRPQQRAITDDSLTDSVTGGQRPLTNYTRVNAPRVYYVELENKWYCTISVQRFGITSNMLLWAGKKDGIVPTGTYTRTAGDVTWPTLDWIAYP